MARVFIRPITAHFAEVKRLGGVKSGDFGAVDAAGPVKCTGVGNWGTQVGLTFERKLKLPARLIYGLGNNPGATLVDEAGNRAPAAQLEIEKGGRPTNKFTTAPNGAGLSSSFKNIEQPGLLALRHERWHQQHNGVDTFVLQHCVKYRGEDFLQRVPRYHARSPYVGGVLDPLPRGSEPAHSVHGCWGELRQTKSVLLHEVDGHHPRATGGSDHPYLPPPHQRQVEEASCQVLELMKLSDLCHATLSQGSVPDLGLAYQAAGVGLCCLGPLLAPPGLQGQYWLHC